MSEETELLKSLRSQHLKLVKRLLDSVEVQTRMDIRDQIAALSLTDRVLAREKPDESERAGSAVRKYAPEFQKAYGAGRRAADAGSAESDEPDRAVDGGESFGDDDEDDHAAA